MSDPQNQVVNPNLTKIGLVPVDKTVGDRMEAFFLYGSHTTTYILPNGTKLAFVSGAVPGESKPAFVTKVKGYIDDLKSQIDQGHPQLHQMLEYDGITAERLDPLDAVRKKAVLNFMQSEEFKKMVAQETGTGAPEDSTTDQGSKLSGIASSTDIAAAADGASSVAAGAPAALLAALKATTVAK